MNIITLTPNPAIDVHMKVDELALGHEYTVASYRRDAGGKGINTSRALAANDIDSTAMFIAGRESADGFIRALERDNISFEYIPTDGAIRENITIHSSNEVETRLSLTGCNVPISTVKELFSIAKARCDGETLVTLAGKLPSGIEAAELLPEIAELKCLGGKLVLDCVSFTAEDIISASPWLIKPNRDELGQIFGISADSLDSIKNGATELVRSGIENILVTLGDEGAVFVSSEVCLRAHAPRISAVSTVGAGDSSIAGFLAAYSMQKSIDECVRSAVAYGSAACMREGTLPPLCEDIEKTAKNIRIEKIIC